VESSHGYSFKWEEEKKSKWFSRSEEKIKSTPTPVVAYWKPQEVIHASISFCSLVVSKWLE